MTTTIATIILIIILVISIIGWIIILFHKLTKPEWFAQFISNNYSDKDLFTRFVKFLMS